MIDMHALLSAFFGESDTASYRCAKEASFKMFKEAEELGFITMTVSNINEQVGPVTGYAKFLVNMQLTEKGKDLFTWFKI